MTRVADPSGFSTLTRVLNFRRPTPMANESKDVEHPVDTAGPRQDIGDARGSVRRRGRAPPAARSVDNPAAGRPAQRRARDFMFGLFFAQIKDDSAGRLDAAGAKGGPDEPVDLRRSRSASTTILTPDVHAQGVQHLRRVGGLRRQRPRHGNDCGGDARARRSIAARRCSTTSSSPSAACPGFNDVVGAGAR